MKILVLISFLFLVTNQIFCQKIVKVDGYALLNDETVHSGIELKFVMIAPDSYKDSTQTSPTGYYSLNLFEGIYNISITKEGFDTPLLEDVKIFDTLTLDTKILYKIDLTGSLSGNIATGLHILQDSCFVLKGDTLILEPGVKLKFKSQGKLMIFGTLIAEGTLSDSIIFDEYDTNIGWKGLHFIGASETISSLEYCRVSKSKYSAIRFDNSKANISNCLISDNLTNGSSTVPGIESYNSTLVISKTFFKNNIDLSLLQGAAIRIEGGKVSIISSRFEKNSCNQWGSAISIRENSTVNVYNSEFLNNISKYNGASIHIDPNNVIANIINCSFYHNIVTKPTFKYNINSITIFGNANIYNCLFFESNFPIIYKSEKAKLDIKNCCFSYGSKSVFYGCNEWLGEIVKKNSNNIDCDVYNNIYTNPRILDAAKGDVRLSQNSDCIDAGDNQYSIYDKDIADNARIYSPNQDSTGIIDIGAYEFQGVFVTNVESEILQNKLNIFPNPAMDYITITKPSEGFEPSEGSEVKIFNTLGECVIELADVQHLGDVGHLQRIYISHLPRGVYYVRIGIRTQMFVKM
ncbi:MAG: hypothetical protein CVV22_11890 [Ignavibacteriae bacterium HGW-Ignavibacteriae-1]|jgi:hypothetical protein|nr:MAG: hypothetical protein CVV22_11890 [Ignavibacteriae bacterium HGW-Ignavibacteriae-1]